jgi:2-oxoisovalerate dehydrogenase E1 component
MTLKTRGEGVEFWIGGPGEEIHGTATALALNRVVRDEPSEPADLALFGHYRSDALAHMTAVLRGHKDFVQGYFRQALSRQSDPHSAGRQMVMHLCMPEAGIWPVQSPVGMQLSKAAGYARGLQAKEGTGLAVAVVGDGTTGESDFHEAAMAASIWKLPLLIIVTDNSVAITVRPEDGRGITSYDLYAQAFGLEYFECDGYDFLDTFKGTASAARWVMENKTSAILKARVPRLMGHSSSSGGAFDFDEPDPILNFGQWILDEDIIDDPALFARETVDKRKGYFDMHRLGIIMDARLDAIREVIADVRDEPTPSVEAGDLERFAHPPYPQVEEPRIAATRPTRVQINEALNLALDRGLEKGNALIWGQDVGHRGGIFQVTAGLLEKYPDLIRDAPINEPLILGTAVGAAMHKDLVLLPEIQFGDYSLNCLHWIVYMGNLYWTTNGQVPLNLTLRFPVDPVQGGAPYHSMSCDGFYGGIPGIVLTCPSTAYDAYGLLRTSMDYMGPVIQMEPKRMYRMRMGHALPGEPDDPKVLQELRRSKERFPIDDYRIPFGKAAMRRVGTDVTIVTYGWVGWQAMSVAKKLASEQGIETEILDLRTIKPYDRPAVLESAKKTGRVLVLQNDRMYAGYGREIQGDLVETLPGIIVRLLGQRNTPAVGQARTLENATVVTDEGIERAILSLAHAKPAAWLENELHWLGHAPGRSTT